MTLTVGGYGGGGLGVGPGFLVPAGVGGLGTGGLGAGMKIKKLADTFLHYLGLFFNISIYHTLKTGHHSLLNRIHIKTKLKWLYSKWLLKMFLYYRAKAI